MIAAVGLLSTLTSTEDSSWSVKVMQASGLIGTITAIALAALGMYLFAAVSAAWAATAVLGYVQLSSSISGKSLEEATRLVAGGNKQSKELIHEQAEKIKSMQAMMKSSEELSQDLKKKDALLLATLAKLEVASRQYAELQRQITEKDDALEKALKGATANESRIKQDVEKLQNVENVLDMNQRALGADVFTIGAQLKELKAIMDKPVVPLGKEISELSALIAQGKQRVAERKKQNHDEKKT